MRISGIYKIQSVVKPERCYVGSAINIANRWACHLSALKRNKHGNKKLQYHYNKYGKEDLRFSVLLGCIKEELITNEQFFIDALSSYFNIALKAGSNLGVNKGKKIHSENYKRNLSEKMKGNLFALGYKATKEQRKNISEGHKGEKNYLFGKHLTEETKKKLSLAHIGHISGNKENKYSEESKNKLSESHKGKVSGMKGKFHTKEAKEKNRLAHLGKASWNKRLNIEKKIA